MSWSPVTSAASDDSSTSSGDDNAPLSIQDIEKWHNRTTAVPSRSSFNTDNSTLDNDTNKGASGETTDHENGSGGSSGNSAEEGEYNGRTSGSNNDYASTSYENSPRQVVTGLPWRDNDGHEGEYTGEVNNDNVPDGLGLFRYYSEEEYEEDVLLQHEGEWRNGTLIRKKGIPNNNVNALSTIEEEKSHKSSSVKYTDEFANFLASKQIEDDTAQNRRSSLESSNSMDAHTTGENSHARDFPEDAGLYSSTSTRQSNLYSSTNSRPYNEDHYPHGKSLSSSKPKRSPDASTTFQETDSESDRHSISSGENYIDYSDSQQQQQPLVERSERSNKSSSSRQGKGRGQSREHDDYDERNQRKVPHQTIDAIQKLVQNDSQVEYDSEESSDDDDENDDHERRGSMMFNWHEDEDEKSTGSLHHHHLVDEDDNEMCPSMGTQLRNGQQNDDNGKRRSSLFSRLSRNNDDDDGTRPLKEGRSRKWCYIFSTCCVLSIVGIAVLSWALVRMRKNKDLANNANMNVPSSQSKEKDNSTGTKVSLTWDVNVPCADVTIDIITDQYGNETTWALYRLEDYGDESKMLGATRSSLTRKRLRPAALSDGNRRMEELIDASQIIKSGGPYTYIGDDAGSNYTSPVYTSSVCLSEGKYSFVVSDVNGICCQYGLGQYAIYFNDGRTIRASPGLFMEKEMTPFEVTSDDITTATASTSPSHSPSPSKVPSTPPVSNIAVALSPEPTEISGNVTVSLNSAPQSPQPTLSSSGTTTQPSMTETESPILSSTNAPSTKVTPPPSFSESAGATSQPSVLSLPSATVSPVLTPTIAPSILPSVLLPASMSPSTKMANSTTNQPSVLTNSTEENSTDDQTSSETNSNITDGNNTTLPPVLQNNTEANSTTSPPSSSFTSWPSDFPSLSPSQIIGTTLPTRFFPSSSPTTTSLPSIIPTIFNPLLDVPMLDSLSTPFSLSHILAGETHNTTLSRRLQDESTDSLFGFSTAVSADMSILAVGAPNAPNENGDRSGAVFLYSIDASGSGSTPTLLQTLYGSNAEDEFGNDVKLSNDGSKLVVAARSENEQEGAIRIYERSPEIDEWYVIRTIVGAGADFRAGWSVAISGDGNVVAMGSTKGSTNEGGMVITYVAPDWTLYGSIIEAKTPRDVMGFSVSLNGDGTMVAVGSVKAPNPDKVSNAGRAEVFVLEGETWTSQFEVFGDTKQAYVGSSVALSNDGNLFVVGGRGYTDDGESAPALGRCRIFGRNEAGEFELLHAIVGTNAREELGWSASISADGNKVACGGKDGKMLDVGITGVARVWDRVTLELSEVLPRGERFSSVEGANFGSSVSLSSDGSMLVVGASTWTGTSKLTSASGAVQIFDTQSRTSSSDSPIEPESTGSPSMSAVITASPTAPMGSSAPTASAPPSSLPTDFDPILDIEVLESLSSPYKMDLLLQGEASESQFGFSTAVSADMSLLAVGAPNAPNENGDRSGAVFLYSIDASGSGSTPTLLQTLYGSNAEDEFGNDVKLSNDGSTLVVAARSENEQEGAIRVYNRGTDVTGGLFWGLSGTILGDGAGFRAGWSVAISGDGNVVAMGSTKGGSNEGGIVSTYVAPDWTLYGSIIEAQTPRDVMGFSVSLNGDGTMVAVGSVKAPNPDKVSNAGRAEVFVLEGETWTSQFEVFGENRQGYDGSSVALSNDGSMFVVGGRGYTDDGDSSPALGRCRIFERTGTGEYELLRTILGTNAREELGWSASISGDGSKVACGGKDGKMLEWGITGVARVWDRVSLQQSEVLPQGERFSSVNQAGFGSSVSLSNDGSSLVVGAWEWNGGNVTSPGSVFSFSTS